MAFVKRAPGVVGGLRHVKQIAVTVLIGMTGHCAESLRLADKVPSVNSSQPSSERLPAEVLSEVQTIAQVSWCSHARPEQTRYSLLWHEMLLHVVKGMREAAHGGDSLTNIVSTGSVYAFGVAHRDSMTILHGKFPDKQIYGFDSFEGLPHEDHGNSSIPGWEKGNFDSKLTPEAVVESAGGPNKAHAIKGFFNESLTPELVKKMGMGPATYVDIDCDLHISTYDALDWLFANKLARVGTLIGYDDWWTIPCFNFHERQRKTMSPLSVGEGLAHTQIAEKHKVGFQCVAGPCSASFMRKIDSSVADNFARCDLNNNWGPVFMVTSLGETTSNGFQFSDSEEKLWMEESKVCVALETM